MFGGIDPITGNPDERHFPTDGSVWFINPGVKHWATNDGDAERVHLILSVDSQDILDG
jgi:quercetin dioxygenase-like cupin family protein